MANTLQFLIGGTGGHTAATDYTSQVVRCGYSKNFCGEYDFDMLVDGVNRSDDGTALSKDKNTFFIIENTAGTEFLLMKGVIKTVKWTDKYRCQLGGVQCKRGASGGKGGLENLKAPQLTQLGEINLSDLLSGTAWFDEAKAFKDNGVTGEGKDIRPW